METVFNKPIDKFIKANNWFDEKYRAKSDGRFSTLKTALNLFFQRGGETIVETGCVRQLDDFGAGYSTVMFVDALSLHRPDAHVYSVDIDQRNVGLCLALTNHWKDQRTVTCSDSVAYLRNWDPDQKIDLLYLDSYDYPIFDMLDHFGNGRHDPNSWNLIKQVPELELVERFKDLVMPCQKHCLNELNAALPALHDKSVVLIDDNSLAGGGKSRLARHRLYELGWECLLDYQQTLWIKKS